MFAVPTRVFAFALLLWLGCTALATDYAVVVSKKAAADPEWKQVVDAVLAKHKGELVVFDGDVVQSLPALKKQFPRYACFVARPEEATRAFVGQVHRLTRQLDDDPYTDCLWGILTGYDAANALRIARHSEPLVIRKVAAGTELAMEMCEAGVWYCELKKNRMVKKEPGKEAVEEKGPDDTTRPLVNLLNDYRADLLVTSGHATEHDWMIGFRYKNGFFRCENGVLFGQDTQKQKFPIRSDNPKVYLPIGNCLMGHIDGTNCMALAFMNSAGVHQMIGYTVPTWYGYMGWGMLDYFVEQPGRFTCSQAFVANQNALIHRLATYFPELLKVEDSVNYREQIKLSEQARAAGLTAQDGRGLLFDRDVVAFYGDPAWQARMADRPKMYEQVLTEKDALYTLEIKPNRGAASFKPVNTNGVQRGYRPVVQFLPQRINNIQIVEGAELNPVIADDFVLVPNPRQCEAGKFYRVSFKATPAK